MPEQLVPYLKSFFPKIKEEELSWNNQNILEILFFTIIDKTRKLFHSEKNRSLESFFDKVINMLIIFFILFVLTSLFFILPVISAPGDLFKKIMFSGRQGKASEFI